jgi:hypothetical protein
MAQTEPGIERREHDRFPCTPPLRASFFCGEGSISAHVDDISRAGAKLRVPYSSHRMPFLVQGEFDYTFHAQEGQSQLRGRTAWVQRVDEDFIWGIEFTNCAQCIEDPLGMSQSNVQPGAAM